MFEAAEIEHRVAKREFEQREPVLRTRLLEAQERLAGSARSVVVVVAGAEGAGKGATVNTLVEWLDARGIEVHALGAPTTEEDERPPLFRYWRRLPPHGEIGIFFGSWYTIPIVGHSMGHIDDDAFERELDRIVAFERMLHDEGVVLLKLWLHVSKKRQQRVFEKLEADPDTAWRVTPLDWEYHETYDEFVTTSSRAVRRTDQAHASWQVIAARDRRYRELEVGGHLLRALEEAAAPDAPAPDPSSLVISERNGADDVNIINSIDLSATLDKDEYEDRLSREQGRLGRLARRMSQSQRAAVVVFEGPDAAGKGGAIRRMTHALDARWYRVVPVAAPTDEELARPYLWRFWRRLPARGHLTFYDRSWYGRVLVERVEDLCAPDAWKRAYSEINAFEEQLVEHGILVLKFWLAISPEEQLRRFVDRRHTPYKQYKLTEDDWRNRGKWLAYESAASDMVERTSTEIAPWTLVAADDKRHARIRVLETVRESIEQAIGKEKKHKRG